MVRLRDSSPIYLTEGGVDFGDYTARLLLRRAARRVVERGASVPMSIANAQPERLTIVTVPQRKAPEAERRWIAIGETIAEPSCVSASATLIAECTLTSKQT